MSQAAETVESVESPNTLWNSFKIVGTPQSNPNPEDQKLQEELKEDGVEVPEEQKKPEVVTEQKPVVVTEEKVKKEPSEATRQNFARLEKEKKEAVEKAAKLESDYLAAQARLKELEERSSQFNPEDFQKQLQEREERLALLQNELKTVALERDPDFIAKYDRPQIQLQDDLKELAVSTGVTAEEFQRAFKMGLVDRMEEIRESLPPHQQRAWDARITEIERVKIQRELALKNRDQSFEEITQTRHKAQIERANQLTNQNLQIARQVALEPFEKIEILKEDKELQTQVKTTLEAIAGGNGAENWSTDKILRQVAASVVLPRILEMQGAALQERDTKLAQLQKELDEANDFIKSKHGSLPRNEVATKDPKTEDKTPVWDRIKVVR
jgi:hypothetical protein